MAVSGYMFVTLPFRAGAESPHKIKSPVGRNVKKAKALNTEDTELTEG
ncbi:MAG: hypothetical protein UZ05_CHB002000191 [Chlorobi bacterium OLB5]|nr:MAG: hypothetical protein UZ05_CHB002000191 [Chlorobi bacterium OLB5]